MKVQGSKLQSSTFNLQTFKPSNLQLLILLTATITLTGCSVELPVRPDEVLLHFKSLNTKGHVRRLWPEGQAYVNAVIKASQDFDETLEPVTVFGLSTLKPLDDKKWKRHWRLQDTLDDAKDCLEDPVSINERQEAWDAIFTAVEAVPPSIVANVANGNAFAAEVYELIGFSADDQLNDVVRNASKRVKQFTTLYEEAIAFRKDDDPAAESTMHAVWLELTEDLIAVAEKSIESKNKAMAKHWADKAVLKEEKERLKTSGEDPERYRTVMFLMNYHHTAAKAAEATIGKLGQLIKRNREAAELLNNPAA